MAPGDDPQWDASRSIRRSMTYRELGDQRSDKSREWRGRGPPDAEVVELSESASSSVAGRRKVEAHGAECVRRETFDD